MLRLTKDLHTPHDDTTYSDIVNNAVDRENIVLTRLKHYEDIVEELGIDLITLFKVLKSKEVICKHERGIVYYETTLEKHIILGLAFDDEYYGLWVFDKFGDEIFYYTKDYGKTWALTREELENE